MAVNKCQGVGAIGVLVSVMVAAGLVASLYVPNRNSGTAQNVTTTTPVYTTSTQVNNQTRCGYCGPSINVTLRIQNSLVDLNFNHTLELSDRPQRELIFFLEEAARIQEEFRFSAEYHPKYGYFINTINGHFSNFTADGTWWQISDGNNVSLTEGVSQYLPNDNEMIIFTLVNSTSH